MVGEVPAVQFAVRLLVPPNSKLLVTGEAGLFGPLDAENFTYRWQHPDPRMDELHLRATEIVEGACGCSPLETFLEIERAAFNLAGLPIPEGEHDSLVYAPAPRLTEDWFC